MVSPKIVLLRKASPEVELGGDKFLTRSCAVDMATQMKQKAMETQSWHRAPEPKHSAEEFDIVFFDGHCGLCHHSVKFLLSKDNREKGLGPVFNFAPLQGETFLQRVPEAQRAAIPDSLVVLTRKGKLLIRSRAVLYALGRLSRPWRILASLGRLVPTPLLDLGYRLVARSRSHLFPQPDSQCPLLPPHLRSRFLP